MSHLSYFLNFELITSHVELSVCHMDGGDYEMEDCVDLSTEEVTWNKWFYGDTYRKVPRGVIMSFQNDHILKSDVTNRQLSCINTALKGYGFLTVFLQKLA